MLNKVFLNKVFVLVAIYVTMVFVTTGIIHAKLFLLSDTVVLSDVVIVLVSSMLVIMHQSADSRLSGGLGRLTIIFNFIVFTTYIIIDSHMWIILLLTTTYIAIMNKLRHCVMNELYFNIYKKQLSFYKHSKVVAVSYYTLWCTLLGIGLYAFMLKTYEYDFLDMVYGDNVESIYNVSMTILYMVLNIILSTFTTNPKEYEYDNDK